MVVTHNARLPGLPHPSEAITADVAYVRFHIGVETKTQVLEKFTISTLGSQAMASFL